VCVVRCPGAALASPLPSKGMRMSNSPLKTVTFDSMKALAVDEDKENMPSRRSSGSSLNSNYLEGDYDSMR
jgi:hypothetical protein